MKTLRQEIHWVPESRMIPLPGKPTRVWTLMTGIGDPNFEHKLPIQPEHLKNAFLEDYVHDWNMSQGNLRYYSRVAKDSVWILVEF